MGKGSNENLNGLIRQYIPKKTDFSTITDEYVAFVEKELNERPRKRHGFKSPIKVFNNLVAFTPLNPPSMLFCDIGNIKVDMVAHSQPLLFPVQIVDGIRMFSIPDIIAMKCNAICRRGTKKDLFDIWQILQVYTPKEIIDFFTNKYSYDQLFYFAKNITYFEDAETSPDPQALVKGLTWSKVKLVIEKSFNNISL